MSVDPAILLALEGPFGSRPVGVSPLKLKRGYPDFPGTGPAGETCRTCGNRRVYGLGSGERKAGKCALTDTRSKTTDTNQHSPACSRWIAKASHA